MRGACTEFLCSERIRREERGCVGWILAPVVVSRGEGLEGLLRGGKVYPVNFICLLSLSNNCSAGFWIASAPFLFGSLDVSEFKGERCLACAVSAWWFFFWRRQRGGERVLLAAVACL